MHIRTYLFLMAASILVPVIVFAGLALGMLQNAEKAAALRGLHETANGMALLVDRELYSAEAALTVLAASPSLAAGDLKTFYQQARTANRGNTGWTVLRDRNGLQIMNTAVPYGQALPQAAALDRVRKVMSTQGTLVSDVIWGPVSKRLVTTLNVPVPVAGGQRYVLAESFSTDHFHRLISGSGVPRDWLVAIIDSQGRFIARSMNSETLVGQPARPELVDAARRSRTGQVRHRTIEGTESYDVFTHSSVSGWTIAVAAPVALIERSARNASFVAAMGLLAATLGAIALAIYFGRMHVRSIGRAVDAAIELGKGKPPAPYRSRVLEVNELHAALHATGEQLLHAQAYRKHTEAERQALLERERKARQNAEQQSRAKDQFLAMLGHELRNPLAPISTAAQLLRLPSVDPARVRYASEVISRQVEHMNSLLGDMLDVSRVTRGLVALKLEQLDLKGVLERAVEQTHGLIEARRHQLAIHVPDHAVFVRGDKTRLIQVIANLLNNAAKYTAPHGQITVSIGAEEGKVKVMVQDNGEGIALELQPRLFDLFSQGERTPDRSQGGLGLGLALVKSLVQLHGGTVWALSEGPGLGSRFSVLLPASKEESAPAAAAKTAGERDGKGARIMIVDDNADGADSLSLFLEAAGGHQVVTCYDAAQALAAAPAAHPEVFILDIGLPDMTGYELAAALRATPQFATAMLIALTGYGQPQDKERARAAGFDGHVSKPAQPGEILALVASRPQARLAERAAS